MIKRLGIIGDLHGEHERLALLLEWFAAVGVDAILCTGDVADGRGCINRSCELLEDGGVTTVAGNHDRWLLSDKVRHLDDAHHLRDLDDSSLEYLNNLPRWRTIDTIRGQLVLCHGVLDNDMARVWPGRSPDKPEEIRRSPELDDLLAEGAHRYLINGHMHFRLMVDFAELTLLNAGTIKGEHAGVTVLDLSAETVSVYSVGDSGPPIRLLDRDLDPCRDGRRIWENSQEFDGNWHPATLYARD